MKRIVVFTVALVYLLISDCYAMHFNSPQNMGEFMQSGKSGGYTSTGITKFSGKLEGVAVFGNNRDNLYIHFKSGKYFKLGAESISNTVEINLGYTTIYQITTDSDLILYVIEECEPTGDYTIIGKRADGKFIKFISTENIKLKYWGRIYGTYEFAHMKVLRDKIVFPFGKSWRYPSGEFVLKWDENADWFSIDKIDY